MKDHCKTDVKQVQIICADPNNVTALAREAERRFTAAGSPSALLLSGVTSKRRESFLVLEATRGIPSVVRQWLEEDPSILDATIYEDASILQERKAFPTQWYQSHLDAPSPPEGYTLLAEPMSIDLPSDEQWIGLVQGEEGIGVLFYAKQSEIFFLPVEEALRSTLYFYSMMATLLACCDPGFRQAHSEQLAALQRELALHPEEDHDA